MPQAIEALNENREPASPTPATGLTESPPKAEAQAAAPTADTRPPETAPAVVPSAPSITPATISEATKRNLEAARSQIQAEAERMGVRDFGNYAFGRLREAIASGQAEQVRSALQEIRNSPQLAKLSSELRERLGTLQGEVEGTLEKPVRNMEEWFGKLWKGLPEWARGGILISGVGYGLVKIGTGLYKVGSWLLKKIGAGIKAGWNGSKAVIMGTLKWGAIIGGVGGASIFGTKLYDKYKEKKDTPPGGAAA